MALRWMEVCDNAFGPQLADHEIYNIAWQKIFNYASDLHECLSNGICFRSRGEHSE